MTEILCVLCAALPNDETESIFYPPPVRADEWLRDDQIRGAFIGAAIGDALGGLHHRGEAAALPGSGRLVTGGATQLSLFTAEGFIRMQLRAVAKGIGPAWDVIRRALDRWMWTQGRKPVGTSNTSDTWPEGWLVRQHGLHRRIDGFSGTVSALSHEFNLDEELVESNAPSRRVNTSNGTGALVRVFPAGLIFGRDQAMLAGAMSSSFTHGGPDGYLAAAALAGILMHILEGRDLPEAVEAVDSTLVAWPGSHHVRASLRSTSGDGTDASEALAEGVLFAGLGDEPIVRIQRAVASGGGTAAGIVAGAIVGAMCGASGIEALWRTAPDVVGIIEEIAQATSVANRAWVMGRDIEGWDYDPSDTSDEHVACGKLWPRFPGW